jgi:hypothetical protein
MSYLPLLSFGPSNHRFRFGLFVNPVFRPWSASLALPTTGPNMPYADFCSAVRLPRDSLSRRNDTEQISRAEDYLMAIHANLDVNRTSNVYSATGH